MAVRPIDANALHAEISKWPESFMYKDWVQSAIANAPTLTPPNEPLTLEQLREMDEPTPVWWKRAGFWCLCERGFIIAPNGNIYEFEETDGIFYRHPPEGDEDA